MTVQEIVSALDTYTRRHYTSSAATALIDAIGSGTRTEDTPDNVAQRLIDLILYYEEKAEDAEDFEDKIDAAAREIEQAERFRQPDLIHEAYRTLTGTRLYV